MIILTKLYCFKCRKWWSINYFIYKYYCALIGIASARFTLIFSLTTGIVKKLLSITRNKKKKHDKTLMLAKSKLNSIETLVLQAYLTWKWEFITIFKEEETMRLSSIKSKTYTTNDFNWLKNTLDFFYKQFRILSRTRVA